MNSAFRGTCYNGEWCRFTSWSKDFEVSSDVRLKEREGFAMLLGWLEKFVAACGLSSGREACQRFCKEEVRAKPQKKWHLDQWGGRPREYF